MKLQCLPIVGLLFLPLSAFGAGFDCEKANTLVEKAICADNELSSLDDALLTAYKQALSSTDNVETVKNDQKNWLKNTRDKCKTTACLKSAYTQRVEILNDLNSTPKKAMSHTNTLPKKVGACVDATLTAKTTRFEGAVAGGAGGEVNIGFSNELGLYITKAAYLPDTVNVDEHLYNSNDFAKGDSVKICLVSVPKGCPPGDDRGKIYTVTNYKNKKSFTGIDAWHSCGGA